MPLAFVVIFESDKNRGNMGTGLSKMLKKRSDIKTLYILYYRREDEGYDYRNYDFILSLF